MSITRVKLSASSNGAPITVTTGTAPATLHTTTGLSSTCSADEVHIWFVNNGASTVTISYFHGTTNVDPVVTEIPAKSGPFLVSPGWHLTTLIAYALAGATGVSAYGFANRLTTG